MVTCPICMQSLKHITMKHMRRHGYVNWTNFLNAYPEFEQEYGHKKLHKFWGNVTEDQINQRRQKQSKTWYSALPEEQQARKDRRSQKTKLSWQNLSDAEYKLRCLLGKFDGQRIL